MTDGVNSVVVSFLLAGSLMGEVVRGLELIEYRKSAVDCVVCFHCFHSVLSVLKTCGSAVW